MNINEYINPFKYFGPMVNNGQSNHLPMAQYSLYSLGCSDDTLNIYTQHYINKVNLENITDFSLLDTTLEHNLGNYYAYGSYVTYFTEEVRKHGLNSVITKTLDILKDGFSSGLFHPIIRLSFAVTANNEEEAIRALSYLACDYKPVNVESSKIDNNNALQEIERFIKEHKGDFYLLHTITGFEALFALKSYFKDYNDALDFFMTSVLKWLERVNESTYKNISFDNEMDFEEMKFHIKDHLETHSIKLLYSTEVLNRSFSNSKLSRVTYSNLHLDHGL